MLTDIENSELIIEIGVGTFNTPTDIVFDYSVNELTGPEIVTIFAS